MHGVGHEPDLIQPNAINWDKRHHLRYGRCALARIK